MGSKQHDTGDTETKNVDDPRRRIWRMYQYMEHLTDQSSDVIPHPYPVIRFYVDGEQV